MSEAITGSCLCGEVRFALTGAPVWAHSCHCSRCRKTSGSACATNLFVPIDALVYTQGEEHLRSYKPPGAERFNHVFCALCGSTLPFANQAFELAGVPMGSLDDEPRQRLRAHIFVESMPPWFTITDDLPQHPTRLGSADEDQG
jgi:hypothetical protein